jgi:hypothetical protein
VKRAKEAVWIAAGYLLLYLPARRAVPAA